MTFKLEYAANAVSLISYIILVIPLNKTDLILERN